NCGLVRVDAPHADMPSHETRGPDALSPSRRVPRPSGWIAESSNPDSSALAFRLPRPVPVATQAAVKLMAAASDSHSAGAARFPVASIRYVATAGVKPPKMAVARLKASENAAVRTSGGIISARNGIIAPL